MKENNDLQEVKNTKVLIQETNELREQVGLLSSRVNELQSQISYLIERQRVINAFFGLEMHKLSSIADGGILLCGNYGNPNIGDEWMLDTMLSYIRKYTYRNITVMLESNYNLDPSIYLRYNINYIHYPQNIYDYDVLVQKFDTLIFGGGAIVEDNVYFERYDNEVNICRTVVDLPLRFIAQKKTVLCIGLSTSQKIENQDYINKLGSVINFSDFFSVRDIYSLKTIRDAGIVTDKIKVIPDIIYANIALQNALFTPDTEHEKINIGIVFICAEETKNSFVSLINKLDSDFKKTGRDYHINLIPFYDYQHADIKFYRSIVKESEKIKILPYDSNIKCMIKQFRKQDMLVCARYHAILLAFSMGIPCIPLYYNTHQHYFNKISYLMEQFGKTLEECIPMSDIQSYNKPLYEASIQINDPEKSKKIMSDASESISDILEHSL